MSASSSPPDPAASARLQRAMEAIDAANAGDPEQEERHGERLPRALIYGQRMSAWLDAFAPNASTALKLAARAQHIERWKIPRGDYPMDRKGYHQWRRTLADYHAERTGEILSEADYPSELIQRVQSLLRKENLKSDPDTQTLEDVICLVFLRYYLLDFARPHEEDKVIGILQKTWGKMSPRGRTAALALPLAPEVRRLVERALGGGS